jgi:hypothetical protein
MRPKAMIHMADAVHVERVQNDLLFAHGGSCDELVAECAERCRMTPFAQFR